MLFFFFQAEDGIRDIGVTGVQTCALPICFFEGLAVFAGDEGGEFVKVFFEEGLVAEEDRGALRGGGAGPVVEGPGGGVRMGERRGGEGGRCWWSADT